MIFTGRRLVEKLAREFGCRLASLEDFFFRLILELCVLVPGKIIFSREDADLFQPLGINIDAASRLTHGAGICFLPFLAEEPVEEHFGCVGMGAALMIATLPLPPLT